MLNLRNTTENRDAACQAASSLVACGAGVPGRGHGDVTVRLGVGLGRKVPTHHHEDVRHRT